MSEDRWPTPKAARGSQIAEDGHTEPDCPPLYVITGGQGHSGMAMVHSVLKQFPNKSIPVITNNFVHSEEEVYKAVAEARKTGGAIVHTLVNTELRRMLIGMCRGEGIAEVDLLGPLQDHLSEVLGVTALEEPGRYYRLHKDFFDRVDAIEYTLSHDDGKNPEGWNEAEIVLIGVSRSSKTPLSYYLADHGWKVANYPVVNGITPPEHLFELDRRRVFGLDIDPELAVRYRQQRQRTLGSTEVDPDYTDPLKVVQELEFARAIFKKGRFSVIDVTETPVEGSAGEIERKMEKRLSETKRLGEG